MRARTLFFLLLLAAGGGVAYYYRDHFMPKEDLAGIVFSNGRIEATEIDLATKLAGRVEEVLADEGDYVTAGSVIARMDTAVLDAQLREAKAELSRAETAVETANSVVNQRKEEKSAAESVVAQREAEFNLESNKLKRADKLVTTNVISEDEHDERRAAFHSAEAALAVAKANVAASEAAVGTARSQVIQAESAVIAARASIERIQADINDSTLVSPRDGRVQFRVSEPGEVLDAGGKVLNLVDLSDVYMTFFLPTNWSGRVPIGAEARIVLDSAPQFVIPAKITFVADVAQFTPKTVETAEERQKLTFRLKAQIDKELLQKHIRDVKTGLPGVAYVKYDERAPWPAHLEVRLPEEESTAKPLPMHSDAKSESRDVN